MCQPLPGPRCAGHMRGLLDRARDALNDATQRVDETAAALRALAAPDADLDARTAANQDYFQAVDGMRAAERAHRQALRDYETTPEGQLSLQKAIARLEADGDREATAAARVRLHEAVQTRERQVADLAASHAQAARLANLTPAEMTALDQVETAALRADQEWDQAQAREKMAWDDYRALDVEYAQATRRDEEVARDTAAARSAVIEATRDAQAEAKRLYLAAGVADRYAGFYVADMAETATGRRPESFDQNATARQPLRIKVKRSGADRDKTLAAQAAAETDPGFQAANRRLAEAIAEHRNAQQIQAEVRREETAPVRERRQEAYQRAKRAEYETQDAATRAANTALDARLLRAQIAADAGTQVQRVSLAERRAEDLIVRNPDGSINAWVYREPSEGFPNGRYLRTVGITTVHGMGPVNGLLLENGEVAAARGHYARHGRGMASERRSGDFEVIVSPPQPDARPLVQENHAEAGFYAFVDSTD